ncbi:MAG: S41 family peptidase [Gemmatimonadota bacterium]|nr:MAG: S41 family peptidase [Gemmatimonadota bacterium]
MKYRRVLLVSAVVTLAFVSGGWLLQGPQTGGAQAYERERLFEEVLSHVARYYVDTVTTSDLYDMAIEGMLDRLNDPYTAFLRPEVYEELNINTTGDYGGVGIRIESRDQWITIVGPLADTPGDRAGLQAGDLIVEINGMSTKGWTTAQAADVMRGEPGTDVELKIGRAGIPEPMDFTITRARIHVNFVEGRSMVAPGVGYVQLTSVSREAPQELRVAVDQLRAEGAKSLILDLRANPGGILEQGVAIADLFLDRGDVVVEMKGRARGASQTFTAGTEESWHDMPIVVLVGRNTASAAEIISGALQDHDRALVLGTRTFGKGVAYVVLPLSETEALSVTTSRWYTPSGRSIDRPVPTFSQQIVSRPVSGQVDSSASDTVEYRSASGRLLQGGGGIVPDVNLPDTLDAGEQTFARVLGADLPKYRDVIARYSLDLKGQGVITSQDFQVTDAMLEEFHNRLRARGVEMPDSVWVGARDLVADQFGFEIARNVFGREAELLRRIKHDIQVSRAVELLRTSPTQEQLLASVRGN